MLLLSVLQNDNEQRSKVFESPYNGNFALFELKLSTQIGVVNSQTHWSSITASLETREDLMLETNPWHFSFQSGYLI